jgi:tetratricopeptide (TPR) repeat protein
MPNHQKQAVAAFKEALRCQPENADYYTELGLHYQRNDLHRKALEMFQKALEIRPNHRSAQRGLANIPKPEHEDESRGLLSKIMLSNE